MTVVISRAAGQPLASREQRATSGVLDFMRTSVIDASTGVTKVVATSASTVPVSKWEPGGGGQTLPEPEAWRPRQLDWDEWTRAVTHLGAASLIIGAVGAGQVWTSSFASNVSTSNSVTDVGAGDVSWRAGLRALPTESLEIRDALLFADLRLTSNVATAQETLAVGAITYDGVEDDHVLDSVEVRMPARGLIGSRTIEVTLTSLPRRLPEAEVFDADLFEEDE